MATKGQWRNIGVTAAGLVLLLTTGCATKLSCANQAFDKNPLLYRQVQVLPVVVTPAAHPDMTLTTNDVWQINTHVASNLVLALRQSLQAYGFDVLGQQAVLGCPDDWSRLTESCASNIVVAHRELSQASHAISSRLQHTNVNLTEYRLTNTTAFACADEVASNTSAIVLMHSTVVVESKMERNKRRGQIALLNTVGVLAGFTYWHSSPSGVVNTMAIVDSKTFEILWWSSWRFSDVNLADTNAIAHTVTSMMAQLPTSRQQPPAH